MTLQRLPHILLLCLALAAFAGSTPVSAAPAHQALPEAVHAQSVATTGRMLSKEVFGFALASSLGDPSTGYPSWDFSLLSTVAFFGLHIQPDGDFIGDSYANVWNSSVFTSFLSTAHAHGAKVLLTIIDQDFSAGTPSMCAALSNYPLTVAHTLSEVRAKGVDGVNIDYEGLNGSCGTADPSWARHRLTTFVAAMRAALPPGSYLSVDTYAGAAADPFNFFDVPGLSPYVDAFFVMAYDLEYSNWSRPPLSCPGFCLGPTAPLSGYYYNDTRAISEYTAAVPASKVILGVPYYGRKACVAAPTPNAQPVGSVVADAYTDASGEATAPGVAAGSYVVHRDANDPGQERWDTWFNTTLNCTRELYWDDPTSLGLKYDLINRTGLRGVGIWNLNYGGGAPELWNLLASKFATTTAWTSLGGVAISGPGAASWGSTRTDVFVVGTDSALWHRSFDGTAWGQWQPLGGVVTADPRAASWSANRIDVFVRGSDGQLWHRWWAGSGWYNWEPLGGTLASGPAVATWGPGRLDVFVRGTDNQLWHKWYDAAGWHGWEALGGDLTSDPTAVAWGPNRIDVFARGTDYEVWHRWWDGQRWNPWEPLGGVLLTGPATASCAAGHLDLFALGTDQSLYQRGFNGTWGAWQKLGGIWSSTPGAVCSPGTTTPQVFERGPGLAVWQTAVPGS